MTDHDAYLDPDDPWDIDPESPTSPSFPYSNDVEIVARLWWIEVIRRLQAGGPLHRHHRYADDVDTIIQAYASEFRDVIEQDLDVLHQIAVVLETEHSSSTGTYSPFPDGLDQAIATAVEFLDVLRRIGEGEPLVDNHRFTNDLSAMIVHYAVPFRQVLEHELAICKELFHAEEAAEKREEDDAVAAFRREVDLHEARWADLDQPHPDADEHD